MKDLYARLMSLADNRDGMADENPYSDIGLAADALRAILDHRPVSVGGWECDICGREVNGQTDDDGRPVMRGDSVRHTVGAA